MLFHGRCRVKRLMLGANHLSMRAYFNEWRAFTNPDTEMLENARVSILFCVRVD